MPQTFEDILTSMLEQLENNPNQDIDVLVKDCLLYTSPSPRD